MSVLWDRKPAILKTVKETVFCRKRRAFSTEYTMEYKNGHIEVYDFSGRFLFSADNMEEARWDLREMGVAC